LSPYGALNRTNIGTQTIFAPVLDATGLLIDQDDTAGDGSHTSANQQALGVQSFIVGKTTLRRWFQIGYHQKNTDEILLSAVTRAPTSCY